MTSLWGFCQEQLPPREDCRSRAETEGDNPLEDIKRRLANQIMLEESLSISNNRETQFEKVWGSVYLELNNL